MRSLFRLTTTVFLCGCHSGVPAAGTTPAIALPVTVNHPPASEIFQLPRSFRGPVLVIYDQLDGSPGAMAGDTSVYEIPTKGVLKALHEEPRFGTRVKVRSGPPPSPALPVFPSCEQMRVSLALSPQRTGVCWLDEVMGTDVPNHIAFLATDWDHIPADYNRGMDVVDSVLFHGTFLRGGLRWVEPKRPPPPGARSGK